MGPERMRFMERVFYLNAIDSRWKEHLYAIDYLKEGIFLRAYAQKDPLVEFQHEAFSMFELMLNRIEESFIGYVFHFQPVTEEEVHSVFMEAPQELIHEEYSVIGGKKASMSRKGTQEPSGKVVVQEGTYRREGKKIGRNDPCPCGSGKKYKHCCGKHR